VGGGVRERAELTIVFCFLQHEKKNTKSWQLDPCSSVNVRPQCNSMGARPMLRARDIRVSDLSKLPKTVIQGHVHPWNWCTAGSIHRATTLVCLMWESKRTVFLTCGRSSRPESSLRIPRCTVACPSTGLSDEMGPVLGGLGTIG
jgi:hypothetical protein